MKKLSRLDNLIVFNVLIVVRILVFVTLAMW